jgi:hypothetical protein
MTLTTASFFSINAGGAGSSTNNPETIHMIANPIKIDAHSKLDLVRAFETKFIY